MFFSLSLLTLFQVLVLPLVSGSRPRCYNRPGGPGFPTPSQWAHLNASVGGRLIPVVPSAEVCRQLPGEFCPLGLWQSTSFRKTTPGAMDAYNWEQDYTSTPPSLCLVNETTCGQGNVPLYAINASNVEDIQAGITFASTHHIKLAVKASGHDFLGRSTAPNSLLIWTQYLRNSSYTDTFFINGVNKGKALTIGSGVSMNTMHTFAAENGVVVVGAQVADVVVAGGYAQGAGHSPLGPLLGLAADNVLQYQLVLADGQFLKANEVEHPDLFWALRGGGAGSWGAITSITVRAYPMFNLTLQSTLLLIPTSAQLTALMNIHTKHVFDWDAFRASHYYTLVNGAQNLNGAPFEGFAVQLFTYFPDTSTADAERAFSPLLKDINAANFTIVNSSTVTGPGSQFLIVPDDGGYGTNTVMGSRLIPPQAFREDRGEPAEAYTKMMAEQNVSLILGNMVAGGKVSENAHVNNAVTPKWRTAKVHLVASKSWPDTTTVPQILQIKKSITTEIVPLLANLTREPDGGGAYSNEADVNEPRFQETFFGGDGNYEMLWAVKRRYDPDGMFIVRAGVGSEDWDAEGFCRK